MSGFQHVSAFQGVCISRLTPCLYVRVLACHCISGSLYLHVRLSPCQSVYMPGCLHVRVSACQGVCLHVRVSACQGACMSACLYVKVFACQGVCMSRTKEIYKVYQILILTFHDSTDYTIY